MLVEVENTDVSDRVTTKEKDEAFYVELFGYLYLYVQM